MQSLARNISLTSNNPDPTHPPTRPSTRSRFAIEARDLKTLESLVDEAARKNMQDDITVLQASDCLKDLIAEREFKLSHPAFMLMTSAGVDEASATKYLQFMISSGYDCLFGLASLSLKSDNGTAVDAALKEEVGIRSAIHRERIVKAIPRVKLLKQDHRSLEAFLSSIGLQQQDVKRYIKNMWKMKKLDTMFDLLNCDRKELEEMHIKPGHVDSVLMIGEGLHSKFAIA